MSLRMSSDQRVLQWGLDLPVEETRSIRKTIREAKEGLQWGLDLPVEETQTAVNETVDVFAGLQWGLDLPVEETQAPRGRQGEPAHRFNGASTFRSRKHPLSHADRDPRPASMGPRPSGRGNDEHDGARLGTALHASMGPRPSGRGNHAARTARAYPAMSLQWGLDLPVEETLDTSELGVTTFLLQWGLDLPVEETCVPGVNCPTPTRFNGASTFRSRKPPRRPCRPASGTSFNGASTFRSRKPLASQPPRSHAL